MAGTEVATSRHVTGRCLVLVALLASGCAPAISSSAGDATITAAVVTALLNNDQVDGTQVNVRTDGGVVYLEGTQSTSVAASEVVALARAVDGVRDVQAQIDVVGTAALATDNDGAH